MSLMPASQGHCTDGISESYLVPTVEVLFTFHAPLSALSPPCPPPAPDVQPNTLVHWYTSVQRHKSVCV